MLYRRAAPGVSASRNRLAFHRGFGRMHMPDARRYDLVISDIDGCLQPESSGTMDLHELARVAEHNEQAAARRDRPLVTLCSGRPQPFVEALCKLLRVVGA